MKGIVLAAIAGIAISIITACGSAQKPKTVEMTAINLSAAPSSTELVYQIINPTDSLVGYGAYHAVDRHDGSDWIPMPVNDETAFIDIMYSLQPGDTSRLYSVSLFPEQFEYPAGEYRIRKDIFAGGEKKTFTAPFTLEGERTIRPTVTFRVEPDVYDCVPDRITYTISNGTTDRIEFGTYFQMDRLVGLDWQNSHIEEMMAFNDLAIYVLPGSSYTGDNIYLPKDVIEYPSGIYRLRKQVVTAEGEITVYATFRIGTSDRDL